RGYAALQHAGANQDGSAHCAGHRLRLGGRTVGHPSAQPAVSPDRLPTAPTSGLSFPHPTFKQGVSVIPVILSGGSGTRLWPMSRAARPKQFISLMGTNSLFQSTLQRLQGLDGPQAVEPLVICNESHRFIVAEQCRELGLTPRGILLEPVGRNTAPAVAIACLHALTRDPEALLLVLPADHHIESIARFHEALRAGMDAARQGKLVTFGIV